MARAPQVYVHPMSTSASRMAGEALEESPDFARYVMRLIRGGGSQAKDAVGGITQGAKGAAQGANGAVKAGMVGNAGKIIGGTGVLAALGAATEFADTDDPVMRNASQAAGNFGGSLAGATSGAALGSLILPGIGTAIGGIAGGILGSNAGSGLGGGIYDMFNKPVSPEEKARQNLVKNAAVQRQIAVDDIKAQIPLQRQAMEIARNDDFLRAERDLRIQNEYNYANAINQALNNAQQNAAMQQQAIAQIMMG